MKIIALVFITLIISGCGVKGGLYLPDEKENSFREKSHGSLHS